MPSKSKSKNTAPAITPEQRKRAAAAKVAADQGVPDNMVATKRPAGDIVKGDRISRKMAGPFSEVRDVTTSKTGATVTLSDGTNTWSPKAKTDVWVLVPKGQARGDKPAPAKPAGKSGDDLVADQMDALDGVKARVTVAGGDVEPFVGKIKQHSDAGGERRWKVGARVVSVAQITGVERADEPEPTPTPDPTTPQPSTDDDVAKAKDVLPGYIVNYVEQHGSTDPMAPMAGDPFVQAGRLYLQLEGRGGAGKKDDVAASTGLRPFLRDTNGGLGEKPKRVLQLALTALGFTRKPFPYLHPERGSTAASYYSVALDEFPEPVHAEPRQTKRDQRAIERATSVRNPALAEPVIPQRPDGSDEDVERLDALWAAYDKAREAWKQASLKRRPQDEQDAAMQATRDANAELLAHRKAMVAKLPAVAGE
jgi:hypothetical protein